MAGQHGNPGPHGGKAGGNPLIQPTLQCPCDGRHCQTAFRYDTPPPGETAFAHTGAYNRAYDRCELCGHWFSRHAMDLGGLYGGAYVDNTYGNCMRATYERIMALPPERSDNAGRADYVIQFAATHLRGKASPSLLDVGSGLAVFPARMRAAGWDCTALDPDPRAASHAREVAGLKSMAGDFMTTDPGKLGEFDVITFNKVLEHVTDPVAMLARARALLAKGGFVYFEVPDGESASAEGSGREEFFIEHHHVFSTASSALLAERAGFRPRHTESLREPSGKFTIRLFADLI